MRTEGEQEEKKVTDVIRIAIILFAISITMLFWGFGSGNEFTYDERKEDSHAVKREEGEE